MNGDTNQETLNVEIIEVDFRKPERHEQIADEAKIYWDEGLPDVEIGKKFGCGRALVTKALDFWYETRGLVRPDGRTCKKRLKGRRKAEHLQSQIMELWN